MSLSRRYDQGNSGFPFPGSRGFYIINKLLKESVPRGIRWQAGGGLALPLLVTFTVRPGWGPKLDKRPQRHFLASLRHHVFVHQIHSSLFQLIESSLLSLSPVHRCAKGGLEDGRHWLKISQPAQLELKCWPLGQDATLPQTDPGQGTGLGCSVLWCHGDHHMSSQATRTRGRTRGHRSRGGQVREIPDPGLAENTVFPGRTCTLQFRLQSNPEDKTIGCQVWSQGYLCATA